MAELNLTELREVAEAATPGPWQMWNDGHVGCPDVHLGGIFMPTKMSDPARRWDDARFASTFDPPTVLALLDRVAELEAVVGRVEALADDLQSGDAMDRAVARLVRTAIDGRDPIEILRERLTGGESDE